MLELTPASFFGTDHVGINLHRGAVPLPEGKGDLSILPIHSHFARGGEFHTVKLWSRLRRAHGDTFEPLPKSLPGAKNGLYPSYGGTTVRLGEAPNQIGWSHCTSNVTIRQVTAAVPVATSKPDLPKWNNHSYVVVLAYSLLGPAGWESSRP